QISNSSFTGMPIGVQADLNGFVSVKDSVFHQLGSFGVEATSAGFANVVNSLFTNNGTGINAAPGTTVRATNNRLFDNTNAIGGTFTTGGDNKIAGPSTGIVGPSLTTQSLGCHCFSAKSRRLGPVPLGFGGRCRRP